jgi:Transposase
MLTDRSADGKAGVADRGVGQRARRPRRSVTPLNLRARITGSVPGEREVRDRLFAFYDWCAQNDDIPELPRLARTISRWEDQIVCAVLTGVTDAAAESLNRLAKLEARLAYGFRNPASQRRRVRIACTRDSQRPSHTEISRRTHSVTERKPVPG